LSTTSDYCKRINTV